MEEHCSQVTGPSCTYLWRSPALQLKQAGDQQHTNCQLLFLPMSLRAFCVLSLCSSCSLLVVTRAPSAHAIVTLCPSAVSAVNNYKSKTSKKTNVKFESLTEMKPN